jgi:antitoxin YefM
MQSTYRVKATELNSDFIESLKNLYKDRMISITVSEEVEYDETGYLIRSEANRMRLLEVMHDVKEGKNLIPVDVEKLKAEMLK